MDWYVLDELPPSVTGEVGVTDAEGHPHRLTAAAAVAVTRQNGGALCVPDASALAGLLVGAGAGFDDLCTLAAENRLLCLAVAGRLRSGSDRPCAVLADLGALEQSGTGVARHGPGGVFAATRGALALGAAASSGLELDPRTRLAAIEGCREVANERFSKLVAHPDAVQMFQRGKQTVPDENGLRPTRSAGMREWLGDQLTTSNHNRNDRLDRDRECGSGSATS